MRTFFNLFARSPFAPLQTHMQLVSECVFLLPSLFDALKSCDSAKVGSISQLIAEHEHQADIAKNDIRNHLPKGLFLPIDRGSLLEILAIQDNIADKCEDIAVLVTLKKISLPESFSEDFQLFLLKNIEAFQAVYNIMKELHELLESSFGGLEAEKVKSMVEIVGCKEHEADILQKKLLKNVFSHEEHFTFMTFSLWQHIFEATACISNLAEKLANRVRMTLEVK